VIFVNSAALSKIRRAAGTCHAKVAVDTDSVDRCSSAGKLFQVSGPEIATNGCGCLLHVEFAGGGRPQASTSYEMKDRPVELSEI